MTFLLNSPFETPFNTVPFSKIKTTDFLPAIKKEIKKTKKEIEKITSNTDEPSFENTIEALEYSGEHLERITSTFFNLNSAETNSEIQKVAQQISPLLSEFANDIRLNEELFKRVKAVYNKKPRLNLTIEQQTLLDKKYKSFSRNGANLNKSQKERLREIDTKLSKLTLKFGENVLAETNAFELHLTNNSDLAGLPQGTIEAAAMRAKDKNKDGWIFTLDYPSYIPFMKYCENRELRKEMALAFGSKAFKGNQSDNQDIILKIVSLRFDRARLLGFNSHAHFILEERMAETPEKVNSFLSDLLRKAKPAAIKEFQQLEAFAKKLDDIDILQSWDGAFYTEKLKQKLFALNDELLKPYFELNAAVQGVFKVSEKLFGLQFKEVENIDKYHPEVKTYEVLNNAQGLVAILYTDFHPRPGKRNGAWMTTYKSQYKKDERIEHPHVSIVCNFSRPTEKAPSLLTFNELTTLFHEFGHALHGMLANTTYPSLSGTSVFWDFVELPSQLLENWCYEKEALELFAKHNKTGETIPMELIKKIKDASTFMEGIQTVRQISFAMLDMSWHYGDPTSITNIKEQENGAFENTRLYPKNSQTCMSTAFSHIFQGGYSSGYYSYKWAEVLDADAFEHFKDHGIFNNSVASQFQEHILSKGGTENPMDLYKKFRGKEPQPEALLRRAGLLDKTA